MSDLPEEPFYFLISGAFKAFKVVDNQVVLTDNHFFKGDQFNSDTNNGLDYLKYNDLNVCIKAGRLIISDLWDDDLSCIIVEPIDHGFSVLKHQYGYLDANFKTCAIDDALKAQAITLSGSLQEEVISNLQPLDPSETKGTTIVSADGVDLLRSGHPFQILLPGDSSAYTSEFEDELMFSYEHFQVGDIFKLIQVDNQIYLQRSDRLYLEVGMGPDNEYQVVQFSAEVPKKPLEIVPHGGKGTYVMHYEGKYVLIDWPKSSCGFNKLVESIEDAQLFQFIIFCTE